MTAPVSPDYTVSVRTLAGTTTISDAPVSKLTYSKVLNGAGSCSFELPIRASNITQSNIMPAAHEILISRGGSLVWGGNLWSGTADVDRQIVTFTATDWFSRLGRRLITEDLYWFDTEQDTIAWGLIAFTQGVSTLGITRDSGHTNSGVTRSRHWCCWQGSKIGDMLLDLASADDGFDFEITPAKVWKVYHPQKGSPIDKTFDTGDNCSATRLTIDGGDIVTQVSDIPSSNDCADIQTVEYSASETTYGLLQEALNLTHVKVGTDRLHMLNEELRVRKRPHTTVELLTPDTPFSSTAYDVGDNVKFTSAIGWCTYSAKTMRVMGYEMQVADSAEFAKLSLDAYHHLA